MLYEVITEPIVQDDDLYWELTDHRRSHLLHVHLDAAITGNA